jgi:hypothetical protein
LPWEEISQPLSDALWKGAAAAAFSQLWLPSKSPDENRSNLEPGRQQGYITQLANVVTSTRKLIALDFSPVSEDRENPGNATRKFYNPNSQPWLFSPHSPDYS